MKHKRDHCGVCVAFRPFHKTIKYHKTQHMVSRARGSNQKLPIYKSKKLDGLKNLVNY